MGARMQAVCMHVWVNAGQIWVQGCRQCVCMCGLMQAKYGCKDAGSVYVCVG